VDQKTYTHRFDNGLTLVAEPMDWLESVAFAVLVPAGCSREPASHPGLANFACEMVQRGCGERDNRKFVEDLENLGVDRSASVSNAHTSFGGAMPAERIYEALPIFADLLLRPHLPEQQLEEGRQVCFQEIFAVEDDLAQRTMLELRRRHFPEPYGRSCHGTMESVSEISHDDIRIFHDQNYRAGETILSVAGNFEWPRLRDEVGQLLGDWFTGESQTFEVTKPVDGTFHIEHPSSQTQIGVAYSSVPYRDPKYFQARGAVGVLSDGMSSRLFTEVREKRGLCYSVYANLQSLRDYGSVMCYSGTSTDRAQETLDVMVAELQRLAEGIEAEELERLKVQIRSGLIMQQESSRARASVIAGDWYHLGRVRSVDEVNRLVRELTVDSINTFLKEHPPRDFSVVTLGQQPLEMPRGVSTAQA